LTVGQSAGRNPLVPLPGEVDAWLRPDAVLVTHPHFDHFDSEAARRLPKEVPILCPPAGQERYHKLGFEQVIPVDRSPLTWNKLQIWRVGGRHGHGLIGRALGQVSGFIIRAEQEPCLYIVGDTVWHPAVSAALAEHRPEVMVVNAGAAQFNIGAPITMTVQDVVEVCRAAPGAKVVAVHMEAINHCRLTRRALAEHLARAGAASQVVIPEDGEKVEYG
jgi:L-ascorbate metabolism protein UlaG (beta-lactamase superfamily)